MRFFAHDGTTTHGPAGIEDLLKLPGFDGDTLVCPVGSSDSADWKPALAYAQFKKALLEAPLPAAAPAPAPKPAALPPLPVLAPAAAPLPAMPVPEPFPLPLPPSAAAPAPAPAPVLPPAPKTVPCPKCKHANLEEAVFCNSCGARMDGTVPAPAPAPAPTPAPVRAPEPAFPVNDFPATPTSSFSDAPPEPDAFSHLDPMLSYPTEIAPKPPMESARRPLQPGKMGQLAAFEEPESVAPSPAPALAPEPAAPAESPAWKRPIVAAAVSCIAVIAAGAAYMMLGKGAPAPVAELNPSASSMPMPEAETPPLAPPTPVVFNAPAPPAPPPIPTPKMKAPARKLKAPKLAAPATPRLKPAPEIGAAKPKRARKPRPARAPKPEPAVVVEGGGDDTMIESSVAESKPAPKKGRAKKIPAGQDPLLESLLADATQPSGEAAAEAAAEPAVAPAAAEKAPPMIGQRPSAAAPKFSLPGLQRPASASDRAMAPPQGRAPAPVAEEGSPVAEPAADAALAEPGRASPPPGIEDEPAKPAEGDQLALVQVHEQFDFCAQLLAQGAYGDHYDTCLCKDAREAAPYRGRRGFYVSALKKEAAAGKLATTAKIVSSSLSNGEATVKARWKSGGSDKGRESSQMWKLEDGLWCQAP